VTDNGLSYSEMMADMPTSRISIEDGTDKEIDGESYLFGDFGNRPHCIFLPC
jgi:hypothetical protein